MWIQRDISALITKLCANRPALLLTGARQTGKSSLLQRLFPEQPYVSLDIPLNAKQASESGQFFLESRGAPLTIDEIQYAPELFRQIKIKIDQHRQLTGQYIMTGSQKFSLMKGVSESLAGRIAILNLHSLSAKELQNHYKTELTANQILEWMIKGGYPEIYEHNLEHTHYYGDYIATYIERDVRQLLNIRHIREFDQFMRLLAIRSGQIFSMSRIATEVGVSTHTIKSWISVLETSNIIYLLKPYYQNYGKRIIKSPKLYFLDTGLLCNLTNIQTAEMLINSPLLGAFFETYAFGQLLRSLHNAGKPDEIYYFRDKDGREVDFLIPTGNLLNLYECKWSDESGEIPKNIKKLIPVFGEENISSITTITTSLHSMRITEKFKVSNVVEL
ncbi:MAG: ATP-binding protein [Gammaproteobacteria bacterium]|nr:ATP-binding protein [Gammaproteobacteria bacterium]MBT4451901.1 ATP-binding protein [Gammaproteobacteria bacterium]MBT4861149.1 ATP-binding protein [Gammaproteobacteria bacterium]